jgi:hypothetical protein
LNAAPARSVYRKQPPLKEATAKKACGDCPVILSLQKLSTEKQAHSRLAVLRQELGRQSARQLSAWDLQQPQAYGPSLFSTIFGAPTGKPGGRMLATVSFSACRAVRLDTRPNAKQEGSP